MKQVVMCAVGLVVAFLGEGVSNAQHGHLFGGAAGISQGDPLIFSNGDAFAASSGFVRDLDFSDSGTYAGFFNGPLTVAALPATVDNGGPTDFHAALGARIIAEISLVDAPAGGSFGFWEEGSIVPSISLVEGMPGMSGRLDVSGPGAGVPGADPFGHLHGRRWSATEPGLYSVAFQLFDVSDNGQGGGPIHTPSELLTINFRAVPEPSSLILLSLAMLLLGIAGGRLRKPGRTAG